MNKRKVLSILALCLAVIVIIMAFLPIYEEAEYDYQWDAAVYDLFGMFVYVPFLLAAIVLPVLSFFKKNRAKLLITLSVCFTLICGIAFGVETIAYDDDGTTASLITMIVSIVLCAPVLIWNLLLKNEAVAYSKQPVHASTPPQSAQPKATKKPSLFSRFLGSNTSNAAATETVPATQTVPATPIRKYSVIPANPQKEKAFQDDDVKKYYNYIIEVLCKQSAENYGENAFVSQSEIEQFVASRFGIKFNTKDKAVCKDKENRAKLKKFNKSLALFERHNFGDGKVEIGMSENDYTELKKKIDSIAQAEISELCTKIKPEIENALKESPTKAKVDLPEEIRERLEALSNAEAERFYATLSQDTDDCIQIYESKNSIALAEFVSAIDALNKKFGAENGCVRCAISKALTEIYSSGNIALKTVLGEFVYAQLNYALNGASAEYAIPFLYCVAARIMSYRKFEGNAVKDYQELSDDDCNRIINDLLLRSPRGLHLTPEELRDFALKIIDDSDIAEGNVYQFEDLRDPLYRLNIVSTFINKYIVNNNYLVNSVYLMDASLYYCYEKLCKANQTTAEAVQKETAIDFETTLANLYCFIGSECDETADEASAKRRKEREERKAEDERREQQRQQRRALTAQIEQADIMRQQAEEQRRFNEQQAREQQRQAEEQRRQAEEQRKFAEKQMEEQRELAQRQACAAGVCPMCRRQCGMTSYAPNGLGGCRGFVK